MGRRADAASEQDSVYARFSAEWQQTARSQHHTDKTRHPTDNASRHIPAMELTGNSEHVCDVVVHNVNHSRSDTVAAINPRPGESLAQLFQRLHPDLSDKQLASELQKVLKYNRDYGNDLGDGKSLNPDKAVFLTSVKYLDDQGRITRIEGPTGRVTQVSYDANGISGYAITGPDGRVVEQARKDAGGKWEGTKDGQPIDVADAEIDIYGDITVADSAGNRVGHLTRGDDVLTRFAGGKPVESETWRDGKPLTVFEYEETNNGYKVYARYPGDPQRRVLISPDSDEESIKRVTLALGDGPKAYAQLAQSEGPECGDVTPDQYMARNIVSAAKESAREHNSVGWCYAGVAEALDHVGVHLHGRHAYMAKEQLLQDKRFQVVSINDLRPGDVLVHGRTGDHVSGHIAVYLGDGQEASDHIQHVITGKGYGGTTVFRYVGDRYA